MTSSTLPTLMGDEARLESDSFRAAMEVVTDAVIIISANVNEPGPRVEYVNSAFSRLTGYAPQDVVGRSLSMLQDAGTDQDPLKQMRAHLDKGEGFKGDIVSHRKDGTAYEATWMVAPVLDQAGTVCRWFSVQRDTTELKLIEQHRKELTYELQHRVRNALAMIRSISRRTAEHSRSVEEFAMHLDGRLGAFSRAQAALTRGPALVVELGSLVAEELEASAVLDGPRVSCSGPKVSLRYNRAEMFALVVHELATNALKFGALTHPRGRVRITWEIKREDTGPQLLFSWKEAGVAANRDGLRHRGFGTDLLERAAAYELQARTTLAFEPDGLHYTAELPISDQPSANAPPSPEGHPSWANVQ